MSLMTHTPQAYDDVAGACKQVISVASECAVHCMRDEDLFESAHHCLDAVDVAAACLTIASRGSEHADKICGVTAGVTEACANACASLADDNETMQRCAEVCRACADACRNLIEAR